jgi:hypothetical protein
MPKPPKWIVDTIEIPQISRMSNDNDSIYNNNISKELGDISSRSKKSIKAIKNTSVA